MERLIICICTADLNFLCNFNLLFPSLRSSYLALRIVYLLLTLTLRLRKFHWFGQDCATKTTIIYNYIALLRVGKTVLNLNYFFNTMVCDGEPTVALMSHYDIFYNAVDNAVSCKDFLNNLPEYFNVTSSTATLLTT